MLKVGARVEVGSRGQGVICLDNDDGTWNVEFDDDTEGNFEISKLRLCDDQSLDYLSLPPQISIASGVRLVRQPEFETKPKGWTRFVCWSDTHGRHDAIPAHSYPEADVLLHGGDFTNAGEKEQIESFSKWLEAYPAKHKVIVAGNHDITFHEEYYLDRGAARFHRQAVPDPSSARLNFEVKPYDCFECRRFLDSHIYLEDTAVEVCGYTIYGSPWQPEFCDWAFMRPRGEPMREVWSKMPESVDVLLTHTPPRGHGDTTSASGRVGCEMLQAAIQQRTVSVNVFGHIHAGYGCSTDDTTLYVNASTCDSNYRPINPPIVFDLPPPEELRAATRRVAEQRRASQERRELYHPFKAQNRSQNNAALDMV
jgi:predicted phosphodiesterase